MALGFKMASLVAAVLLLAMTTPQARGLELEDDQVTMSDDMVPVQKQAEEVLVAIAGGAGTMAGSPICLQCRCCSKSSPANCQMTSCCSRFQCNSAGKCSLVQDKCGCSACGGTD